MIWNQHANRKKKKKEHFKYLVKKTKNIYNILEDDVPTHLLAYCF